jgi:hypothetical protein
MIIVTIFRIRSKKQDNKYERKNKHKLNYIILQIIVILIKFKKD